MSGLELLEQYKELQRDREGTDINDTIFEDYSFLCECIEEFTRAGRKNYTLNDISAHREDGMLIYSVSDTQVDKSNIVSFIFRNTKDRFGAILNVATVAKRMDDLEMYSFIMETVMLDNSEWRGVAIADNLEEIIKSTITKEDVSPPIVPFTKDDERILEKHYQSNMIDNFNVLFPTYRYIAIEYQTEDLGRIDILAECNTTKRKVIIELKLGNKNGRRQLRDYGFEFENPILINVSETEVSHKAKDIIYFTYQELGISLK